MKSSSINSPLPKKPLQVKIALYLLLTCVLYEIASVILDLYAFITSSSIDFDENTIFAMLINIAFVFTRLFLVIKISKRKEEARNAFLIMSIILFPFLLSQIIDSSHFQRIIFIFHTSLQIFAFVLLFQKPSIEWFELKIKSVRKKQTSRAGTVKAPKELVDVKSKSFVKNIVMQKGDKNMSWYIEKDDSKHVLQIIIEIPPGNAQNPKFTRLMLPDKYYALISKTWTTGHFRMSKEKNPFLLVRADGYLQYLRDSLLRIAYSFYKEPAGGLFGIFVMADSLELKSHSPTGHPVFECIYGLDQNDTIELIRDALDQDVLHICFAEAAKDSEHIFISPMGQQKFNAPFCRFDRVISIPSDCQEKIKNEFQNLLEYHKSLSVVHCDFQRSMNQLSSDFPTSVNPVLNKRKKSRKVTTQSSMQNNSVRKLLPKSTLNIDTSSSTQNEYLWNELVKLLVSLDIDQKQINPNSRFNDDLKLEHMDILEIIMTIEDHFKIEISDEDFQDISTIGECCQLIQKLLSLKQEINKFTNKEKAYEIGLKLIEELIQLGAKKGAQAYLRNDGKVPDRIKEIGQELYELGGMEFMLTAHHLVLQKIGDIAAHCLEVAWNGIGHWVA